jgi:hypothetical protein
MIEFLITKWVLVSSIERKINLFHILMPRSPVLYMPKQKSLSNFSPIMILMLISMFYQVLEEKM